MKHECHISESLNAELELLCRFNLDTRQVGLKIHGDATASIIEAARQLYRKKLITQPDGGYLTDAGIEAAEHLQKVLALLQPK
jgi:uncharacterized protein (TIGR02647 family)